MFRERVFHALDPRPEDRGFERFINLGLLALIALTVCGVVLETLDDLPSWTRVALAVFELFSVVVFTIEYVLRLWSCTVDRRYAAPIVGRLRYARTPMALIDLVAIAPFFVPWITTVDLRYVRILRLVRLFRVLKLTRYTRALHTLGNVFHQKRADLAIAGFLALLIIVFAASSVYFLERDAQPESFSSIPAAMWWAISTLTTVGYGDVYPITPAGKLVGAAIDVLGVAMFALPAGILATGFAEELKRRKVGRSLCPHCAKPIDINQP